GRSEGGLLLHGRSLRGRSVGGLLLQGRSLRGRSVGGLLLQGRSLRGRSEGGLLLHGRSLRGGPGLRSHGLFSRGGRPSTFDFGLLTSSDHGLFSRGGRPSTFGRRSTFDVRFSTVSVHARSGLFRFLNRSRGSLCAPPGRQSALRRSPPAGGLPCGASAERLRRWKSSCSASRDSQSLPRANHCKATFGFFRCS